MTQMTRPGFNDDMDMGSGGAAPQAKAMPYVSGLKIKCIEWFMQTNILITLFSK